MSLVKIDSATKSDISFIADIILKAEETGFEVTSYQKMFDLERDKLKIKIEKAINNTIGGHPFSYTTFKIAKVNSLPASAFSAYVEGENGNSNQLITGALMSVFNREEMKLAYTFLAHHKEIQIPKTKGNLQIDSVATLIDFRGLGLFKKMLKEVEEFYSKQGIKAAEIQVWKKNELALNVYQKLGYKPLAETKSLTNIGNGKVLMVKNL